MALTSTTEIAGPVNVVFQVNLLRNAKALAPYFIGTEAAEIAEHSGTFTAKWRRIENLTAVTTALTELSGSISFPTRQGVQPSVTDLTATVQKYGNYILLNEEVDLVNFNGQADKLSEILGMNAGQSLNRLQRDIAEDNFTAVLAGAATTATDIGGTVALAALGLSEIASTVNQLNRQDAMLFLPKTEGSRNIGTTPIRSAYWGICHVDTEEDVRTLTGFVPVEQYSSQTAVERGEFGSVGGVRWIATTESSIDTGSGDTTTGSATVDVRGTTNRSDVYNTVVYGREAVGSVGLGVEHVKQSYMVGDRLPGVQMISHGKGSAGSADPLNEVTTMGWKSWHAGIVLNSNWGRTIRHAASVLSV